MPPWKLPKSALMTRSTFKLRLPRGFSRPVAVTAALSCALLVTICLIFPQHSVFQVQPPGAHPTVTATATATEPKLKASEPSYPISGYFISASSRDAVNYKKLEDIKAFGGDTVITFGISLQPATLESIPRGCEVDGKNCARVAAGSLSIDRYFTFLDGSNWGKTAIKCPRDRRVTNNGQSYVVLVLPKSGPGCTSSNGKYDVVVVGGGNTSSVDPSHSLAKAATKLGMKFYAGMPAPSKRADLPYLPDDSYQGTLSAFTERFLAYHASANDVPGLAGFYHHTEMPLTDSTTFDSVLAIYAMQNRAIHRLLPTRQAIVSPYIDARVDGGITTEKTRNGIRRVAQTSSGLVLNIAIQDGMGTGKGAAFGGSEFGLMVDPFAATIVGKGTWGNKYFAPNRDYFSAAAAGVSGTGAVLWANLEGMAPATDANACADSLRGQTTKARLDRQLQQLGTARKIISFMWDSYFTCQGTGIPLKEQIKLSIATPIITDTSFRPDAGRVVVVGFNLKGSTVTLKWTNKKGQALEKAVKAATTNSTYGTQNGMNPRLESIGVDVGATSVSSTKNYYSITVSNEWGEESTEFHAQLP
ncbi:hypothetical protein ABIE37_002323 [Arthrobacter bambusae]|uniref:Uncharacterized protein n=2 Tax=Arthrobacter bambusae TaxID=1338426 RepID=A0ABV2P7K9_9MICC